MSEPLHRRLGLQDDEYDRIVTTLGREPNRAELAMYSVMWSEHCSYKSSKIHLQTLPTEGPAVLVGPGQDAGAVDIGDGDAVVFKMESHSHPSAIRSRFAFPASKVTGSSCRPSGWKRSSMTTRSWS